MRLAGALATLLGRAEGAELPKDELLGRLREWGLITYPSPLLGPLLEKLPEVLAAEVKPRLDSTDLALFTRVGPASRAAVVASGLPRAGTTKGVPLKIRKFVGSVELLAWAKENDCPWVARTCNAIARRGNLQVLRRARELDCPWSLWTCSYAARGGHLEVLRWAREHGCPWDEDLNDSEMDCCALAAGGGHLEVLQWARVHHCPWSEHTCCAAADNGHPQVLRWAIEHGCPGGMGRRPGARQPPPPSPEWHCGTEWRWKRHGLITSVRSRRCRFCCSASFWSTRAYCPTSSVLGGLGPAPSPYQRRGATTAFRLLPYHGRAS